MSTDVKCDMDVILQVTYPCYYKDTTLKTKSPKTMCGSYDEQ